MSSRLLLFIKTTGRFFFYHTIDRKAAWALDPALLGVEEGGPTSCHPPALPPISRVEENQGSNRPVKGLLKLNPSLSSLSSNGKGTFCVGSPAASGNGVASGTSLDAKGFGSLDGKHPTSPYGAPIQPGQRQAAFTYGGSMDSHGSKSFDAGRPRNNGPIDNNLVSNLVLRRPVVFVAKNNFLSTYTSARLPSIHFPFHNFR